MGMQLQKTSSDIMLVPISNLCVLKCISMRICIRIYIFCSVNMDSAPLSASLLADWMDVTSNMDPKALEDIQHELELSSALHDFPFNY